MLGVFDTLPSVGQNCVGSNVLAGSGSIPHCLPGAGIVVERPTVVGNPLLPLPDLVVGLKPFSCTASLLRCGKFPSGLLRFEMVIVRTSLLRLAHDPSCRRLWRARLFPLRHLREGVVVVRRSIVSGKDEPAPRQLVLEGARLPSGLLGSLRRSRIRRARPCGGRRRACGRCGRARCCCRRPLRVASPCGGTGRAPAPRHTAPRRKSCGTAWP
mmetsp:Transcript_12005/g.28561  ORF Transcript_12005/g.28561 Transcript_12005/m.28561 type:complete len:213 (+) Transcript_12005:237-875(+)